MKISQREKVHPHEDGDPTAAFFEHYPSISLRELQQLRAKSSAPGKPGTMRLDVGDVVESRRYRRRRIAYLSPPPYRLMLAIAALALIIGALLQAGRWAA